jgi:hypothetical protein
MKNLVKSVFAKWESSQAVAQFLKGQNEAMMSLAESFFSKQHHQDIGCDKFL